jgi:Domain of unknown function (DUF4157)
MGTFKPFQRKKRFTSISEAPTYPSLRPSRPLASRPTCDTEQAPQRAEEQLEPAARFGHSFERVSPFPSRKKNNTGLPDRLKTGIENLSGMSLGDVNVHYHSSRPAQMRALAYTQGTDIHVGPGQERHLAHEAWHVVQQKQGRVQPTLQARGVAINDDEELEKEAEVMGEKAYQRDDVEPGARDGSTQMTGVIQGVFLRRATDPLSPEKQEEVELVNTLENILKQEMLSKALQQLRDLLQWARDHYTLSNPPPIHGVFVPFFGPDTSQGVMIARITAVISNLQRAMNTQWNIYNSSDDQSGVPPPEGAVGYESAGTIYLNPTFYQQHYAIQYDTLLHEALHATAEAIDIPGLKEGMPVNSFGAAMVYAVQLGNNAVNCAYNLTLFTLVAAGLLRLPQA